MSCVPLADGEGVLVVNNEYTNYEYTFANEAGKKYPEPWTADKVL
jgi:secreted PhoX family phosphatase